MERLNMKQLQDRCKAIGLHAKGKKGELIERIKEYERRTGSAEEQRLRERVEQLESTLARLNSSTLIGDTIPNEGAFESQNRSSPVQLRSMNRASVSNADIRLDTVAPTSNRWCSNIQQSNATNMQGSTHILNNNPSVFQPMVSTTPPTMPGAQILNMYGPGPHSPIGGQSLQYSASMSIKDMVSILPEFDPTSENSLTSKQFVQRVQALRDAYKWRDELIIFAVQHKLKGHAKYWADSQVEIFLTWPQFSNSLLENFPWNGSAADAHVKMANTKREPNMSPQEYYYKMLAMGTKNYLDTKSIIQHIINGINDNDLKRKLSNEYHTPNDLLRDIETYCRFNVVVNAGVKPKLNFTSGPSMTQTRYKKTDENKRDISQVKCYNCSKFGHISSKCPEPQKRERCYICQKTSHKAKECPDAKVVTQVRKVDSTQVEKHELVKDIEINGSRVRAFIDPGSDRTLVRKSYADTLGGGDDCQIILSGFGGGVYKCTRQMTAKIGIDEHTYVNQLLVVDDKLIPEDVLLGRDVVCHKGKRMIIENNECWVENVNSLPIDIPDISAKDKDELRKMLIEHRECFAENATELGTCSTVKMGIELTSDAPISLKPYKCPFPKRENVRTIINELLMANIIRKSNSPYASPIVLVEKKSKELRMCVDYRRLNKITVKIPFPMPIIEEQLAQLSGNKFFSSLDLRMGYHQVELKEESKKYTAFVTFDGHYEFNRMPFGLVNAAAVFQRLMNMLAAEMEPGEMLPYMDDVIIPSKTIEEGINRLSKFLRVIKRNGLTLRLNKCVFLATRIPYLGHTITGDGISPGDYKVKAVQDFKIPTNITETRRFLGLTGFFRKFIQDYALLTKPLTKLLHKSESGNFRWEKPQQESFDKLIKMLCDKPILALYDYQAHHEVHTDASSIGLAGVLLQATDGQNWRVVCYYSRHCTEAESRYHSYELEVLAVVETLSRFRVYLLGKKFRLVTDCSAIAKAKDNTELIPKIARWYMKILEFDFEAVHRPAHRMAHVDALSRAPVEPPSKMEVAGLIMKIGVNSNDWIFTMQLQDPKLADIIAILKNERQSDQDKHLRKAFQLQNSRLCRKDDGLKLVIPSSIRWRIIKSCHDDVGHFGLEKTLERVKKYFWFARMRKCVKEYIAACIECCYNKARGGKPEGVLYCSEVVPVPFHTLHLDHLGPFVRSTKGMCYVLAMSDAFSKFLIVKPVRHTKTLPVINALKEVSTYFGLPRRVVTDRGTAFTSRSFAEFCDHNSIEHVKTAVRTPRANGQVERANQSILSFLRSSTENPKHWDEKLRELQWAVNSQSNSTTGFSPNELVFDFKLRDVSQNRMILALQDEPEAVENTQNIVDKRAEAVINIDKERAKWKVRFDQKHTKPTKYRVDDLVVIANEPAATGESRKLEPKFRGPYRISKVLDKDRYLVTDIEGMQVRKRYFESVYASDKIKPWVSNCPVLEADEAEDDCFIEDDKLSE